MTKIINGIANIQVSPKFLVGSVIVLTFVCAFWIVGGDLLNGTATIDMSALRHIGR
jgi:hypothetical protein